MESFFDLLFVFMRDLGYYLIEIFRIAFMLFVELLLVLLKQAFRFGLLFTHLV